MQQPPRFNPAPVQRSTQNVAPAVGHDAYGHEAHYDEHGYDDHGDHDPAGALGAAYHDYDETEAAYYAATEPHYAQPPASPPGHAPVGASAYPPVPPQYAGQNHHDARYEDDEEAFAPHYEPQVTRRPPARRSSPLLLGVGVVSIVLVLGVGSVFAYRAIATGGSTGANAPLIRADTRPVKEVVAQQPLGAAGPNLDASKSDGQDKLVTQTEDPVDQIPGKPPIRVVGLGAQTPSLAPVQRVRSVIVRPDGTIVTPEDASTKPAPAPVKLASVPTTDVPVVASPPVQPPVQVAPVPAAPVQVTPSPALPPLGNVTHIDPVPVAPKPNPAPPVLVAPKPPVAQIQPPVVKPVKPVPALVPHAPTPDPAGPLALDPSSTPAPPARVAAATPPPVAPAPKVTAPIDGGTGDYMVQISSQRSDAEARHALQVAEQKYAALGAKGGDVQQADLGARGTYYRARLAGGTHDQALALCSQIKAQGGDCVVAKR